MFDASSRGSFENLAQWVRNAHARALRVLEEWVDVFIERALRAGTNGRN